MVLPKVPSLSHAEKNAVAMAFRWTRGRNNPVLTPIDTANVIHCMVTSVKKPAYVRITDSDLRAISGKQRMHVGYRCDVIRCLETLSNRVSSSDTEILIGTRGTRRMPIITYRSSEQSRTEHDNNLLC